MGARTSLRAMVQSEILNTTNSNRRSGTDVAIYCSPFLRVLQTISPSVQNLREDGPSVQNLREDGSGLDFANQNLNDLKLRVDYALCESIFDSHFDLKPDLTLTEEMIEEHCVDRKWLGSPTAHDDPPHSGFACWKSWPKTSLNWAGTQNQSAPESDDFILARVKHFVGWLYTKSEHTERLLSRGKKGGSTKILFVSHMDIVQILISLNKAVQENIENLSRSIESGSYCNAL